MVGLSRRVSFLVLLIVLFVATLLKVSGFTPEMLLLALTSCVGVFLAARESRRRLAIADLLHHERRIARRLRDSSASGVITADAELRITGCNPAMERMTGLKRGAVLGQSLASSLLFPDNRHLETVRLALSGVETTLDSRIRSNDLGPIQARLYCSPVTAEKGRITGVLVIATELRAIGDFRDRAASESAGSSESPSTESLAAAAS